MRTPIGADTTAELQPGPQSLSFREPSDQGTVRVTDQRGLGAAQGWGGAEEDTGLTPARFRSSACLNITLHPALPPSFLPPALCAPCAGLSSTSPPSPLLPRGLGGRREARKHLGRAWEADPADSPQASVWREAPHLQKPPGDYSRLLPSPPSPTGSVLKLKTLLEEERVPSGLRQASPHPGLDSGPPG